MLLPKEHGAWGMLYVPFVVAVGAAGRFPGQMFLLLLAISGFYLARHAAVVVAKSIWAGRNDRQKAEGLRWLAVYTAIGLICGLPLLWPLGYWKLAYLAVIGGILFASSIGLVRSHRDRSEVGELLAVGGLSLSAPSAFYVATGRMDEQAWILWLLNVLYFGGTILYVKMWITAASRKKKPRNWMERISLGRHCILYHVLLIAFLVTGAVGGHWPILTVLAFMPVLLRTVMGLKNLSPQPPIRKIGFQEMWLSFLYAGLIIWAWHSGVAAG